MNENFQNDVTSTFDSFNGTELKLFAKVPTSIDRYGVTKKFELVELGNTSQISAANQYSVTPIPAIGSKVPIGVATGSSMVAGSIVFEALNKGFVGEIRDILKEAGISKIGYTMTNGTDNYALGYSEIENINEFPLLDIVIIGVKENDSSKMIQKEILGLRFTRGGSAIGVNQLGVREAFQFIATDMTDFRPVKGAEESFEEVETSDSIFG